MFINIYAIKDISIHAPREGSDHAVLNFWEARMDISIHAPREGSDLPPGAPGASPRDFYPRSP